jgi:hypothetical protein
LLKHEYFEELAAIAACGELPPAQEAEFSQHLAGCVQCRQVYEEYEELHAPLRPSIDPTMEILIESRREKVKAGVFQSIPRPHARTQVQERSGAPSSIVAVPRNYLRTLWTGVAAAVVISFVFLLGVRYEKRVLSAGVQATDKAVSGQSTVLPSESAATPGLQRETEKQSAAYTQLMSDLQTEKHRDDRLDAALAGKDRELAESEGARQLLQQQVDSESQDLRSTQALLAAKTDEVNRMEAAKASDSNALVALQYQVQELTGKLNDQAQNLDRERGLLANGRDIRDIIGARNLHIIDVYDTDAEGNTRKSFARAFYTEGKSLIFYAYDLPARNSDDGKFVYTAWGERNGNKNKVQRLGILLNDDKGQKRWALNFSDPKVLNEIDSVFVTLERVDTDGAEPKGKRMLTAYLDSQINHP